MKMMSRKLAELPGTRRTTRIDALHSLPLFFPLDGRRVVLAGGTDAAAWKAELLAAAGAQVHVYAESLGEVFSTLIARGSVKGRFVHHPRPWCAAAIEGAALAIADAKTDGEAQAFYCAANAAGVPVNVIDVPRFCAFQFGSIVNRSPVVIGISTSGVAPILGQAIRRRIETLLPTALRGWAALAGRVRARVLESLSPGVERRRFWERFTDLAFSGHEASHAAVPERLESILARAQARDTGRVTLVGAGPGDAEYLTLKAMRALQSADVILFDDLVDDGVLELARREAKRMLVGKRGGRESCRQEDINAMMVSLAKQGKHVVRLKSGDPAIFGRAGEELKRLADAGIPVSVVAGVTAASAMAADLGVSLTHREHAQSVQFVTAHSRSGGLPETVNWRGFVDAATTTVFYMGRRMAGQIRQRLIGVGCDPGTPVCVVANVARADRAVWTGALSDLESGVASLRTTGPVLIGVGQVFGHAVDQMRPQSTAPAAETAFAARA